VNDFPQPPPEQPTRLTIRIYTIRDGHIVDRRREVRVMHDQPVDVLSLGSAFPPCTCPRCR
jgi:hypothetical protein